MIRLPSYLQLNQSGIYYFRSAVPLSLRELLARSEIKCSLRTREKPYAIERSRPISHSIQGLYQRVAEPGMTFKEAQELLQRFLVEQTWLIDRYLDTHGPVSLRQRIAFEKELQQIRTRAQFDLPHPLGVRMAELVLTHAGIQMDPASDEYRRFCVQASNAAVTQVEAILHRSEAYARETALSAPQLGDRSTQNPHGGGMADGRLPHGVGTAAARNEHGMGTDSRGMNLDFSGMGLDVRGVSRPRYRKARRVRPVPSASPAAIPTPAAPAAPALPLGVQEANKISQVLTVYAAEKRREGSWTEKTERTTRGMFELLIRIIGDLPMDKVGPSQARDYKAVMQKLPANLNIKPLYRSKSIAEILAMKLTDCMSVTTVNNHLAWVSTFFDWGERNGYLEKNPFRKLALKNPKKPDEARAAYTPEDLKKLFSTEQYRKHRYKHPHYYWLPLLGLHTGARINELCQLYLKDIRQEDGVWVLDINESEPDQRVKTRAARRLVPIHPKLVELGFQIFVETLRKEGKTRLFSELRPMRDGAGQAASKWFARYRVQLGLYNQKPKKDFHSFRTTLINELKQKGHAEGMVAAIVGHAVDSITFGTYGKAYKPSLLVKVISDVDFSNALVDVRPWKWSSRDKLA